MSQERWRLRGVALDACGVLHVDFDGGRRPAYRDICARFGIGVVDVVLAHYLKISPRERCGGNGDVDRACHVKSLSISLDRNGTDARPRRVAPWKGRHAPVLTALCLERPSSGRLRRILLIINIDEFVAGIAARQSLHGKSCSQTPDASRAYAAPRSECRSVVARRVMRQTRW